MPFIEITEYHLKKMQIDRLEGENNDLFGYIARARAMLDECGRLPLMTEAEKIKTLWRQLDEIMLLAQLTNIVARWHELTRLDAGCNQPGAAIHDLTGLCLDYCGKGDCDAAYAGFEKLRDALAKQKNLYEIQAIALAAAKQGRDRTAGAGRQPAIYGP